jgi:hypothetical protein
MFNIAEANVNPPRDWAPTREQIDRVLKALRNEAYPPAGRSGVGTVLRRVS